MLRVNRARQKTRSLIREYFPESAPDIEKKVKRNPSSKRTMPARRLEEQCSEADVLVSDGRKLLVITNSAKQQKN